MEDIEIDNCYRDDYNSYVWGNILSEKRINDVIDWHNRRPVIPSWEEIQREIELEEAERM